MSPDIRDDDILKEGVMIPIYRIYLNLKEFHHKFSHVRCNYFRCGVLFSILASTVTLRRGSYDEEATTWKLRLEDDDEDR